MRRQFLLAAVVGIFAVQALPVLAGSVAPQQAVPAQGQAKPLMRQLQESFGQNHEIVGHTAFIQTLMSGKLTRPQLDAHLQQRALIHEEIDSILMTAGSTKVPYGDAQRQVLTLLHKDMEDMGTPWPKETDAWPLTKKLLQEIRDSVKEGPFFALGVLHVYYGGITHGGRDIGAIIDKDLRVNLSYYLKSDGYGDYAKQVNLILTPKDQQEMIRGADSTYRYIITSNDDSFFQSR